MACTEQVNILKKKLLKEVANLYKRDDCRWKNPVVDTLRELHDSGTEAVFFGGTLRSLLANRIWNGKPGRPRDIDIVVYGKSIEKLKEQFEVLIKRETRFGGLQLRRREWQFDVWPLHQTWAFVHDAKKIPSFSALPSTTFFNLEAIAVDVWAKPGYPRNVYSGDDQFFNGIINKTLEINLEINPFPDLCVIRALVMAASINFSIGPRLAKFISSYGVKLNKNDLDEIQRQHYGSRRIYPEVLFQWINYISQTHSSNPNTSISLPTSKQLEFWPQKEGDTIIKIHSIS